MKQSISLDNGKYVITHDEEKGTLTTTRHGEPWQDDTGDNLIYFLFLKCQEMQDDIDDFKNADWYME